MSTSISVIIPVLNEEESLPRVLGDLPRQWVDSIIVVDNGSTDGSAEVAREAGAVVVQEPQRGYGAACLRGLAELANRPEGPPDVVVFLNGDGSDYPEKLPELVKPILEDGYDLVLGSRLKGEREAGAMPLQSVWGNRFACFWMWLMFGAKYTDLGPFRAIRWRALERLRMTDRNFGWPVEMQIKAVRHGLRTLEIPVPYRKRISTSKTTGTIVRSGKILFLLAKYGLLTGNSYPTTYLSERNELQSSHG